MRSIIDVISKILKIKSKIIYKGDYFQVLPYNHDRQMIYPDQSYKVYKCHKIVKNCIYTDNNKHNPSFKRSEVKKINLKVYSFKSF